MKIQFRLRQDTFDLLQRDLGRRHRFAAERVGFLSCGVGSLPRGGLVILAGAYHPVADSDYEDDPGVGAMLGPGAFRRILQFAYAQPSAIFHVHRHGHRGRPGPSGIDLRESHRFVPDFWNVCPRHPHGILILSLDSIWGLVWVPGQRRPQPVTDFTLTGVQVRQIKETV